MMDTTGKWRLPITMENMAARWNDSKQPSPNRNFVVDRIGRYGPVGHVLHLVGWADADMRDLDYDNAVKHLSHYTGLSSIAANLVSNAHASQDKNSGNVLVSPHLLVGAEAGMLLELWALFDQEAFQEEIFNNTSMSNDVLGDAEMRRRNKVAIDAISECVPDHTEAEIDAKYNSYEAARVYFTSKAPPPGIPPRTLTMVAWGASWEVLGETNARARRLPFYFLNRCGIKDPRAIPDAIAHYGLDVP